MEALAELPELEPQEMIERLTEEMKRAAQNLDFELASQLRDHIFQLRAEVESGRRVRRSGPRGR